MDASYIPVGEVRGVAGQSFEKEPHLRGLARYYSKPFEMTPAPFPERRGNSVYECELLCVQTVG